MFNFIFNPLEQFQSNLIFNLFSIVFGESFIITNYGLSVILVMFLIIALINIFSLRYVDNTKFFNCIVLFINFIRISILFFYSKMNRKNMSVGMFPVIKLLGKSSFTLGATYIKPLALSCAVEETAVSALLCKFETTYLDFVLLNNKMFNKELKISRENRIRIEEFILESKEIILQCNKNPELISPDHLLEIKEHTDISTAFLEKNLSNILNAGKTVSDLINFETESVSLDLKKIHADNEILSEKLNSLSNQMQGFSTKKEASEILVAVEKGSRKSLTDKLGLGVGFSGVNIATAHTLYKKRSLEKQGSELAELSDDHSDSLLDAFKDWF
jgi:hypothetical protein